MANPTDRPTRDRGAEARGGAAVAGPSRRIDRPDHAPAPATIAAPLERGRSRRSFLRATFWTALGATLAGGAGLFLDYVWPHGLRPPGGPVPAGHVSDYAPGADPTLVRGEREFWLVNLTPDETRPGGSGGGSGLLALWRKCPHLGCAVPWVSNFTFEADGDGWFRCPCHQSTYTKAGVRVYGPAPRSMDTMRVTIDEDGAVVVDTSQVTPGGTDNPERAEPVADTGSG